MEILILASVLSILSVFSTEIGKLLLKWLNRPSENERNLFNERRRLLAEQNQLSVANDFVKYSKLQRRINAIDASLGEAKEEKSSLTLNMGLTYGLRAGLSLLMGFFSIYYRGTPVFRLASNINLFPFNFLITYPNDVNGISFHFWVMCCTVITKSIKSSAARIL